MPQEEICLKIWQPAFAAAGRVRLAAEQNHPQGHLILKPEKKGGWHAAWRVLLVHSQLPPQEQPFSLGLAGGRQVIWDSEPKGGARHLRRKVSLEERSLVWIAAAPVP